MRLEKGKLYYLKPNSKCFYNENIIEQHYNPRIFYKEESAYFYTSNKGNNCYIVIVLDWSKYSLNKIIKILFKDKILYTLAKNVIEIDYKQKNKL